MFLQWTRLLAKQSVVIKANSGISESEIQRMVKEAEMNKAEDLKFAELAEVRNKADNMLHVAKKQLNDANISSQKRFEIEGAVTELENVYKTGTKPEIEIKVSNLEQKLQAQDTNQQETPQQSSSQNNQSAKEDDYIDAEFEEQK